MGDPPDFNKTGGLVTVEVSENTYYSTLTVINGGIAFDPVAAGETLIHATSSGFDNSFPQSYSTVTVTP